MEILSHALGDELARLPGVNLCVRCLEGSIVFEAQQPIRQVVMVTLQMPESCLNRSENARRTGPRSALLRDLLQHTLVKLNQLYVMCYHKLNHWWKVEQGTMSFPACDGVGRPCSTGNRVFQ